ncbi:ATP-binding protein [Helicobacter acinonychis]|nr:ATP-binding protein [Helicobacter acinonychis]
MEEKATDNEQYCVIFVHDLKQISSNYNPGGSLKDLLKDHFKQCLAFECNEENLRGYQKLKRYGKRFTIKKKRNALFINASKDSVTEFRPFILLE